jgi:hypothetical protein
MSDYDLLRHPAYGSSETVVAPGPSASGEIPAAVQQIVDAVNAEQENVKPGSTGGGGSSGGGGSAPSTPAGPTKLPQLDWASAFFSGLGLPGDVQNKVNDIFSQYSDTNAASAAALAYIRGTTWYDQTYPGIKEAFAKGTVSNEADYRALLNQQTQFYKNYLGRDITADEFASNLREGATSQTVEGRLKGASLVGAYGNDWRYALGNFGDQGDLTDGNLKALGEEKAGLDSPIGLKVQSALERATQRIQGAFSNALATPSLTTSTGRLSSPSLGGQPADVGA